MAIKKQATTKVNSPRQPGEGNDWAITYCNATLERTNLERVE